MAMVPLLFFVCCLSLVGSTSASAWMQPRSLQLSQGICGSSSFFFDDQICFAGGGTLWYNDFADSPADHFIWLTNAVLCLSTDNEWIDYSAPALPYKAALHATLAFTANTVWDYESVLLVGGRVGFGPSNTDKAYILQDYEWTEVDPMPRGGRAGHSLVGPFSNGDVYVVCGGEQVIEIYNTLSSTWLDGPTVPNTQCLFAAAAMIESKLVVVGGSEESPKSAWVWDVSSSQGSSSAAWVRGASLPWLLSSGAYMSGVAVLFNTRMCIVGGATYAVGAQVATSSSVLCGTGLPGSSWESLPLLPEGVRYTTAVLAYSSHDIYLASIGGVVTEQNNALSSVNILDVDQILTSTSLYCTLPCQNGGYCAPMDPGLGPASLPDLVWENQCKCPFSYTGAQCETFVSLPPCDPSTSAECANGGSCVLTSPTTFECICPATYTGYTCESLTSNVDPCALSPCRNGGSCLNVAHLFFSCLCPVGFVGGECETSLSAPPLSMAICDSSPCLNGGTCTVAEVNSTMEEWRCECDAVTSGFTGSRCQLTVASELCESSPCANGGTCVGVDATEKTRRTSSVDPEWMCVCLSGFTGDRCLVQNGSCSATAISLGEKYCRNGGYCQVAPNGHVACACPQEFSGAYCEVPINATRCVTSPCLNSGLCLAFKNGRHFCECYPGYTGTTCETLTISSCLSSPCLNGGLCISSLTASLDGTPEWACRCPTGFVGIDCSTVLLPSACDARPCENGGICSVQQLNQFVCRCGIGFTGDKCQVKLPTCASLPCFNGGTCFYNEHGTTMVCACSAHYTGTRCETADEAATPESLGASGPNHSTFIVIAVLVLLATLALVLALTFYVWRRRRSNRQAALPDHHSDLREYLIVDHGQATGECDDDATYTMEMEDSGSMASRVPSSWKKLPADACMSSGFDQVDVTATLGRCFEELMNGTARPQSHGRGRDSHGFSFQRFAIQRVFHIQNYYLWADYDRERGRIRAKLPRAVDMSSLASPILTSNFKIPGSPLSADIGEYFFFHGTKSSLAHTIKATGFDDRVASQKGMFGAGCYFAESASKSDQYVPARDTTFCMFVCRVVLGRAVTTSMSDCNMRRPPCIEGHIHEPCAHERYDSLIAVPDVLSARFREFIVFDRRQTYPEYYLEYKRE